MIKKFAKNFIDFLYPPLCIVCKKRIFSDSYSVISQNLCIDCWNCIDFITPPFCNKCGSPLEYDTKICGKCEDNYCYDELRFATYYKHPISDLILRYKHCSESNLSKFFTKQIINSIPKDDKFWKDVDILTSVPIHWTRKIKRQYNQSALLACDIGKNLDIATFPNILIRNRITKYQKFKEVKKRLDNVKDAFAINKKFDEKFNKKLSNKYSIKNKTIAIVDDVITSGATLHYCAKKLKENGANKIKAVCIASIKRPRNQDSL